MIQTTNDTREFIEEHDEPIFIYGAGNPGTWVGTYMQRCGIEFEGFLDRACIAYTQVEMQIMHSGKRVYWLDKLKDYKGQSVRIVIAVADVKGVLTDLHWHVGDANLYCLLPIHDFLVQEQRYDINCMLGYFRSKLVRVKTPTIIANQCDDGFIYRMLGLPIKSPTVNAAIQADDFIKLCQDPEKYMGMDMQRDSYTTGTKGWQVSPAGKVGDISVLLAHDANVEEGIRRWNTLRKWADCNNLIFVMSDAEESGTIITQEQQRRFMHLPGKKLLVLTKSMYLMPEFANGNVLYVEHDCFLNYDSPVENYFDILGWINGEF